MTQEFIWVVKVYGRIRQGLDIADQCIRTGLKIELREKRRLLVCFGLGSHSTSHDIYGM